MPAKILGVLLIFAGLIFRYGIKRAKKRGYFGPRHQRIHRDVDRNRFNVAMGAQYFGSWICFLGAFLCFTHILVH